MNKNLLILILFTCSLKAQPILFQKKMGTINTCMTPNSIIQTSDSGYVITGTKTSESFLIKTNQLGDTLWTKFFSLLNGNHVIMRSVYETDDLGFIIAGNKTNPNGLIYLKTGSVGNIQWSYLGGSQGNSVQQTEDGGYAIYGEGINLNMCLIKINSVGNISWVKEFSNTLASSCLRGIQTFDKGYLLTGSAQVGSSEDIFLVKTDSTGSLVWGKTYDNNGTLDIGMFATETTDSSFVVTGLSNNGYEIILMKISSTGNLIWVNSYSSVFSSISSGITVEECLDKGFIISGYRDSASTSNSALLIKTDSTGIVQWVKEYGGCNSQSAYSAIQTFDGGFIMTGTTSSFGNSNGCDVYLVKTNSIGNSGCHQKNDSVITYSPLITINNPVITVSSTGLSIPLTIFISSDSIAVENTCLLSDTLCPVPNLIQEMNVLNSIKIFPNPSTNNCSFIAKSFINSMLTLYDVTGRLLMQQDFNEQKTLNLSWLKSGMYIVEIKNTNGRITKQKLIKN